MKRNPWPYVIVVYFVVFATAMTSWIVFAVRNEQELVRKDYYEQEIKFQSEIERTERAQAVNASVAYDPGQSLITIQLPANASKGSCYFYRPARAALDRRFSLVLTDGRQSINVRDFESGLWKIRLSWEANGKTYQRNDTLELTSKRLSSL